MKDGMLTRRDYMRAATVTTGAAVVGGGTLRSDELSPVGDAEALVPLVVGAAVLFGGGAAVGATVANSLNSPEEGSSGDQTLNDLYVMAEENQTILSQIGDTIVNDVEGSASIARNEAIHQTFKSLNSGASETEAIRKAETAAKDYYTGVEKNILSQWNRIIERAGYILSSAYQAGLMDGDREDGTVIFSSSYTYATPQGYGSWSWGHTSRNYRNASQYDDASGAGATQRKEYTLQNGETTEIGYSVGGIDLLRDNDNARDGEAVKLVIEGPDSNGQIANGKQFEDAMNKLDSKATEVVGNISDLVSEIYSDFNAGDVSADDYYSSISLLQSYGNSQGGEMGSTALAHSQMGYDTRLNHTVTIETNPSTSDDTDTNTGILLVKRDKESYETPTPAYPDHRTGAGAPKGDSGVDNGTWYAGVVYDTPNISRTVKLVRQGGKIREITDPFKITGITNLDSEESVNSLTLEDMGYTSNDPAEAGQNVKQSKKAREEMEVHNNMSLWGGGPLDMSNVPDWARVAVPVGAVGAIGAWLYK